MSLNSVLRKSTLICALAGATLSNSASQAHAFEPFLGEVRTFGFNFCPRGWANADGRLLPISQYSALFALFGTIYGGDGRTTFALPDLRGRYVMNMGAGPGLSQHQIGSRGGEEVVTLNQNQIPAHTHDVLISRSTESGDFGGLTVTPSSETEMTSGGTASTGGTQAHNNMPPYTVMNVCVALEGLFPSRN